DGLADERVGEVDAPLPAVPKLLAAGEDAPVEAEVLLDERAAEVGRGAADEVEGQPRLPIVEGNVVERLGHGGEGARLADEDLGDGLVGAAQGLDPRRPVERRGGAAQLVEG